MLIGEKKVLTKEKDEMIDIIVQRFDHETRNRKQKSGK